MGIKLLGIPYDLNSSFLRGAAMAPPRIRLMERDGSANTFAEGGADIREGETYLDLGDLDLAGQVPEAAFRIIREAVRAQIGGGDKLLSLGGDHSIAYPVIEAHSEKYEGLHVLQIDAHGDLYEDFDGNPFSHASPFARLLEQGRIASLTQVGIRSLNTHQREQIERYGVRCIEMKDYHTDFLQELKGPLYLTVDLDALDPAFAPGISHHEPGGMSTRQLLDLIQAIPLPLAGADIVEYNPVRDLHNMTAMVAYKVMKEVMVKLNV